MAGTLVIDLRDLYHGIELTEASASHYHNSLSVLNPVFTVLHVAYELKSSSFNFSQCL